MTFALWKGGPACPQHYNTATANVSHSSPQNTHANSHSQRLYLDYSPQIHLGSPFYHDVQGAARSGRLSGPPIVLERMQMPIGCSACRQLVFIERTRWRRLMSYLLLGWCPMGMDIDKAASTSSLLHGHSSKRYKYPQCTDSPQPVQYLGIHRQSPRQRTPTSARRMCRIS